MDKQKEKIVKIVWAACNIMRYEFSQLSSPGNERIEEDIIRQHLITRIPEEAADFIIDTLSAEEKEK